MLNSIFRKLISLFIIVLLIISLGIPVFATGDDSGDVEYNFAPDRVVVRLAGGTGIQMFSAASFSISSSGIPDLGIAFTESRLLNPSSNTDVVIENNNIFSPFSTTIDSGFNNLYVLTLKETGYDVVLDTVAKLNDNPLVAHAEPDYYYTLFRQPNDPQYINQWALQNINAPQAWDITTGNRSVLVGVIDTGIDGTHPDLVNNIWRNPNVANCCNRVNDIHGFNFSGYGNNSVPVGGTPTDLDGHGTHVAGIIGAQGNNGIGVTGINWNVSLVWLGVDASGDSLSGSAIIDAINYATLHKIPILNASWGGTGDSAALYQTIQAYPGLFVTAAGNGIVISGVNVGQNNDTTNPHIYPASFNLPNIITVAATTNANVRAGFSNFGATSVHIAAPGQNILSTYANSQYRNLNGTSMATPYVAGVAALMLSINPTLNATALRSNILTTARRVNSLNGVVSSGGILNASAAVQSVFSATPTGQFVTRLYTTALGRSPDTNGFITWTNSLMTGRNTGASVAGGFFFSTEFINRNLTNDAFVDTLYSVMLNRSPDAIGRAHWLSQLNSWVPREIVFQGFANSPEFNSLCTQYGIIAGSYTAPSNANTFYRATRADVEPFVTRLYTQALGRNPDSYGLESWIDRLINGMSGTTVAHGFVFSVEMNNKNLSNEAFVEMLYQTLLGRKYDDYGRTAWVSRLVNGMTREQVFYGFANSPEFGQICINHWIRR
ncbi:MAG: DUF4214 domain-containing protein [Oscillospiraceae bacterium]|jgi:subtilisin family serine protease|nr:DUF4214 domain-containing protein [Oscillospiraceae bacterium]